MLVVSDSRIIRTKADLNSFLEGEIHCLTEHDFLTNVTEFVTLRAGSVQIGTLSLNVELAHLIKKLYEFCVCLLPYSNSQYFYNPGLQ